MFNDSPTYCKITSKTYRSLTVVSVLLAAVTVIFDCSGPKHAVALVNLAAEAPNAAHVTVCS